VETIPGTKYGKVDSCRELGQRKRIGISPAVPGVGGKAEN